MVIETCLIVRYTLFVRKQSVGTTELYYSTKKRQHSLDILKSFFSSDTHPKLSYSDECRTKKAFKYVKRKLPIFRAVVNFISTKLKYHICVFENMGVVAPRAPFVKIFRNHHCREASICRQAIEAPTVTTKVGV